MTEEFLNLSQVASFSQYLRRGRMAKPVWVHTVKAGDAGMLENNLGEASTIQCFKGRQGTDKDPAFLGLGMTDLQVIHQGFTNINRHR